MRAYGRPRGKITLQGVFAMNRSPVEGFLRLPQVLALIPISKNTWLRGVESGRYPKPVKLSARVNVWPMESIRNLIEDLKNVQE